MRKTDTSATSGTGKAKPGEKLLKSDRLFYVYIRALVSSQATTLADMALGFALFAWCGLSTALATAIGAETAGKVFRKGETRVDGKASTIYGQTRVAVAMPVTAFVAPGPDVTTATPT